MSVPKPKITIIRCQHDDAEMAVDNVDAVPTEDYYFESTLSAKDVGEMARAVLGKRLVFHCRTWIDYERNVYCQSGKVAKKVN